MWKQRGSIPEALVRFTLVTAVCVLMAAGGPCSNTTTSEPTTGGSTSSSTTKPAGGNPSSGGSSGKGGSAGSSAAGGNGGSTAGGTADGGTTNTGGSADSGGATSNGGKQQAGGTPASGGTGAGGTTASGGNTGVGGTAGTTGGAGGASSTGVSYKLPPPDQCHDQDYIQGDSYAKTGCIAGDSTSQCGGKCQVANPCSDPPGTKNGDYTFMCPRNLLFSPEMEQAAADDGNTGFHYAVVGHDVGDPGGIDGNAQSACCQCYQLVYAYPSPNNDRQVQLDPDNPNPPASAIPIPPPLIVQTFNQGATPTTFDVYMPAGGLGANNACAQLPNASSPSGLYMYTSYPPDGQPSQGGVKPASLYSECKTSDKNWVTTATLTSLACIQKTTNACNQIASNIPGLTQESESGCLKANTIDTFYHLNWSVYVAKVECPENLTRVTG